jgi:regulatory protein
MTYEQALNKAAAMCSGSEHCESQIAEKLRKWEVAEDDAERIIAYLKDEKYIDTARFSRAFVSDKFRYNHWGRMKIRQALRFLHIPDNDINEALDGIDEQEYRDALEKIIAQKDRTLHDTDPYVRRAKLVRHALSRGFETNIVLSLLPEE